jgi:hypothetical protein
MELILKAAHMPEDVYFLLRSLFANGIAAPG